MSCTCKILCHAWGVVMRNKLTSDRMFENFVKHTDIWDNGNFESAKDKIVGLYIAAHKKYKKNCNFSLSTTLQFLKSSNNKLLVLMEKITSYQKAALIFFETRTKKSVKE